MSKKKQPKKTRRKFLGTLATTGTVGLAGCADEILEETNKGSEAPLSEGGRPEDDEQMFGRNNELLPKHVPWQIKINDQTNTMGNHIEQGETHPLNTPQSQYNNNFQTITVEDMTEETWKNILRDDLTEPRKHRNSNKEDNIPYLERVIHNKGGTIEEIYPYVDELMSIEGGYKDREKYQHNPADLTIRAIEQMDSQHWTEKLILGLQNGTLIETDINTSGGRSKAVYTLFRDYAENELGKEMLDDFHVWEIGSETQKNDKWNLNHQLHGLAYEDNGEWKFKLVEPTLPDEAPYVDSNSETIRNPENTMYFDDSTNAVSSLSSSRALDLIDEGEMSTPYKSEIHHTLARNLMGLADTGNTYHRAEMSPFVTEDDTETFMAWFSEEFRDSVEENFTGNFTEENLWNGIYTGRNLVEARRYLGNDKPMTVEGTINQPRIGYAPEEIVEELVKNNYDSVSDAL